MRQRLGLAAALLRDPELLILDEPANGLDPEGVHWLRTFMRGFAAAGKTVFVSSHVLAEVAQTVDRVVIIDKGRLVTIAGLDELTARMTGGVRVRAAADPGASAGARGRGLRGDAARRRRAPRPRRVGRAGRGARVGARASRCTSSSQESPTLEKVFLELTSGGEP